MNFTLVHQTEYLFSDEVFLEPHYFRFRPKQTPFIELKRFSISVQSASQGHSVVEDEEQNTIDLCWFDGMTTKLTVFAESHLQIKDYNPFNFIIHPDSFNSIPFTYSEHQFQTLYACLQKSVLAPSLIAFSDKALEQSAFNTVAFVSNLTAKIHQQFVVEYRESGAPLLPNETFERKTGSCRDLSWMQINVFRHYGIAARFVSGYFYFEVETPSYELHAWVEVFIPGIGWLGCDPSHGILTGNTHFSVACSAIPENTMPVTGAIRGSATSQMTTTLNITKE